MGFLILGHVLRTGGSAMAEVKETKAQRVERLKQAKNAWEHFDEIRAFARNGYASIPPEWFGTYFRSWGVYTQGDGAGSRRRCRWRRQGHAVLYGAHSDPERLAEQ